MKKVEIEKPDDFLKLLEKKRDTFLYQDHPNDGIDLFCDEEIEELGYESVVFDFIKYRDIAEFIENNCKGTLTFNNHPMGFNGFVEVDDIEDVRKKVKSYITAQILLNKLEEYNDEQKECLEFLNIKIS